MLVLIISVLLIATSVVFAAPVALVQLPGSNNTMPHLQNGYHWCIDLAFTNNYQKVIVDGAIVALNASCDANSPFQQWSLNPRPDNASQYAIELALNETIYCVDLPLDQLKNNGAWLQMLRCNYGPNQLWAKQYPEGLIQPSKANVTVFQLVNLGSSYCLDQNANYNIEHLAQRSCFPNSSIDVTAQTWNELPCSLTGCNSNSTSPTFVTPSLPPITTTSTSTSSTSSTASSTSAESTNTGSSESHGVSVSVLGGVVSVAVVIGVAVGVAAVLCLRRSYGLPYSPTTVDKGESNFESRNSNTKFMHTDATLAEDTLVLSDIHYNKPEELPTEKKLVEAAGKALVEGPLDRQPLIGIPSFEGKQLPKEPSVDEPLVGETPVKEPLIIEEPPIKELPAKEPPTESETSH